MPPKNKTTPSSTMPPLSEMEKNRYLFDFKKMHLKKQISNEETNSKINLCKLREKYLKICRTSRLHELSKNAKNAQKFHDVSLSRKNDAISKVEDFLNSSEDILISSHNMHVDSIEHLLLLYREKLGIVSNEFKRDIVNLYEIMTDELSKLKNTFDEKHGIIQDLYLSNKKLDQSEIESAVLERQSQLELSKTKSIELDHSIRSTLEEQIDQRKKQCQSQLSSYKQSTEVSTVEYKSRLSEDVRLGNLVAEKTKLVHILSKKMNELSGRLSFTKMANAAETSQLNFEIESVTAQLKKLKEYVIFSEKEERRRLSDLSINAEECRRVLGEKAKIITQVLSLWRLCRYYETEEEDFLYPKTDKFDPHVKEVLESPEKYNLTELLGDGVFEQVEEGSGLDEWNYLDNFLRKYGKVVIDLELSMDSLSKVKKENFLLKQILTQYLDGVSVNEKTVEEPNTLLVINGRNNLNCLPSQVTRGRTELVSVMSK